MSFFVRTFHPVGQGAFYTEQIIHAKSENKYPIFSAVYDCGTHTSGMDKIITSTIDSIFINRKVNLLFISHFDTDHMNQAYNLDPEYIAIPLLTEQQLEVMEIINTYLPPSYPRYDVYAYRHIQDSFEKSTIIYVYPDDITGGNIELVRNVNINRDNQYNARTINLRSGGTISYQQAEIKSHPTIEYIVYQPKWNEYAEQFRQKFEQCFKTNLTAFLQNPVKSKFNESLEDLKKIYKELGNKNEHSLVVLSNPSVVGEYNVYHNFLTTDYNSYIACNIVINDNTRTPGCIYFGDSMVKLDWLKDFYHKVDKYIGHVGVLQVPHHGAASSSGDLIYEKSYPFQSPPLCIISAGISNGYRHPSPTVVHNLLSKGCFVHIVTEQNSSKLSGGWEVS